MLPTHASWFTSLLRPELAQLAAYHPAHAPADALRLDANESPWALSDAARREIARAVSGIEFNRYPDVRAAGLRQRIAAREGVDPDQLVIGCGSDEVIALVGSALSRPRDGRARATTLAPAPSFVMFRVSSLLAGCDPIDVPLDDAWGLDADAFVRAIDAHAPSVVFLPSPNNPTGNLFGDAAIARVVDAARGRTLVLLDEAYGAFARTSYGAIRAANEHVGQLQTLSKVGLAAARVGWAVLPSVALAREVDKVRQPYNLNALSQRVAELALGELADEIAQAVDRVIDERAVLCAALAAVPGARVAESAANFVWLDVGRDAGGVHRALLERGIVVRSFHAAGGRMATRLRVTVGTREQDQRFVAALGEALAQPVSAR